MKHWLNDHLENERAMGEDTVRRWFTLLSLPTFLLYDSSQRGRRWGEETILTRIFKHFILRENLQIVNTVLKCTLWCVLTNVHQYKYPNHDVENFHPCFCFHVPFQAVPRLKANFAYLQHHKLICMFLSFTEAESCNVHIFVFGFF